MTRKKIVDMVEKDIIFMIRMELSYYEKDEAKREKSTQKILRIIKTKKKMWDFEVENIDHNTMLSYAAYNQSLILVKTLLEKGAVLERPMKEYLGKMIYVPQAIEACMYNKNHEILHYLFPQIKNRTSLIGALATSYGILYDHAKEKRNFIYQKTNIKPHEVFEHLILMHWPDAAGRLFAETVNIDLEEMKKVFQRYEKTHYLNSGDWKKHLANFVINLEHLQLNQSIEEKSYNKKMKL